MKKLRFVLPIFLLGLLLMLATTAFAATTHTVQRGESLGFIAKRYDVSWTALAAENNLVNPDKIYVGQVLAIPGSGDDEDVDVGGDSAESQPISDLAPVAPTASSATSHIVSRGDTLAKVAIRYNVTLTNLARANNIINYNRIYVGQRLTIPTGNVAAPTANVNRSDAKWIDVDLSEQRLVAYEGDSPVFETLISSGLPDTPTVVGQFNVWLRYESQDMNGANLGYDYYLEDVPYVMYFYKDYAIHGAYWHNNFGQQMSHGCVNADPADAQWLFNWSEYGTLVNVHQ